MAQQDIPAPPRDPLLIAEQKRFWRANITLTVTLLVLWALVGPILGIVLVEPLNQYYIGGFPLGFWFAQQGATIGFILIILVYAIVMDLLDKAHRRNVARINSKGGVQ